MASCFGRSIPKVVFVVWMTVIPVFAGITQVIGDNIVSTKTALSPKFVFRTYMGLWVLQGSGCILEFTETVVLEVEWRVLVYIQWFWWVIVAVFVLSGSFMFLLMTVVAKNIWFCGLLKWQQAS
jgi:hypothetical protein